MKKYKQITTALLSSMACVVTYGYLDEVSHETIQILHEISAIMSNPYALGFLTFLYLPMILFGIIICCLTLCLFCISPILITLVLNKTVDRQNPLTIKDRVILPFVWLFSLSVFLLAGNIIPDTRYKTIYSINLYSLFIAVVVGLLWLCFCWLSVHRKKELKPRKSNTVNYKKTNRPFIAPTSLHKQSYLLNFVRVIFALPPVIIISAFNFNIITKLLSSILTHPLSDPLIYLNIITKLLSVISSNLTASKLIPIMFSLIMLVLLWLHVRGKKVSILIAFTTLLAIVCLEKNISNAYRTFAMPCALFFIAYEYIPMFKQWNLIKRLATLVATVPLNIFLNAIIIIISRRS